MNQIVPYQLWIGHVGEDRLFRQLFDAGIQAVVQLALEVAPAEAPRELIHCRVPLLDGPGNRSDHIRLAIRTVLSLLTMHVPTLVCCNAGMSRAPAIAAAAMALAFHQSPEECLQRIVAHHPSDVSPGLWREVVGVLPSVQ
jgi:hypothetical protein